MSENKQDWIDECETVMFETLCSLEFRKPGSSNEWQFVGTEKMKIVYDDEMLCCRVHFADQNDHHKWLFGNVIDEKIKLEVNYPKFLMIAMIPIHLFLL